MKYILLLVEESISYSPKHMFRKHKTYTFLIFPFPSYWRKKHDLYKTWNRVYFLRKIQCFFSPQSDSCNKIKQKLMKYILAHYVTELFLWKDILKSHSAHFHHGIQSEYISPYQNYSHNDEKNTHYLRFSSQNPKIPKYISAQNINGAPANVSTANPIICSPWQHLNARPSSWNVKSSQRMNMLCDQFDIKWK